MYPNEGSFPEIPYSLLTSEHLCYDLIYNPAKTLFIQKSKAAGAVTINGLSMLHLQAEKSWETWNSGDN
jgi:shikimate dehydrogenase